MRFALPALLLMLLLSLSFSQAINVEFYYGVGCPHCAATDKLFEKLGKEFTFNRTNFEVYQNAENRARMFKVYEKFGLNPASGGVPTVLIDDTAMVIGELNETQWRELFALCAVGQCPRGIFSHENFNIVEERDSASALTWPVLIGAAIVDSINPCTIAIMVILISTMLYSKGKREALIAGLLFSFTIFIMYILYGVGILKVITNFEVSQIFYAIMTLGAFVLAIMEVNAYVNYKPGFIAVEMPMFLRPYARKVIEKATSPLGVVAAAVFCSLFLLPCSSGPYLMVLGTIARAVTLQTATYLLVYNLVFILPLILISLITYFGKSTIESIGEWKEKYIRELHLASGIVLFVLFFIMLNELLRFV